MCVGRTRGLSYVLRRKATALVRRSSRIRRVLWILVAWGVAAYVLAPWAWERYASRHPRFSDVPGVTTTADRHPGDPLNVAIVGTEEDLVRSMVAAGWVPADPITFRGSVRIAVDSLLERPDDNAPVSNLYLFGRKQDLAFEKPVGDSPRKRHHVRFWKSDKTEDDRPIWLGAATFDERVGLSHTTGEVTHHIGPDVDAERNLIAHDLEAASRTERAYDVSGFHKVRSGRNGGGDEWRTDGNLAVLVLRPLSTQADDAIHGAENEAVGR